MRSLLRVVTRSQARGAARGLARTASAALAAATRVSAAAAPAAAGAGARAMSSFGGGGGGYGSTPLTNAGTHLHGTTILAIRKGKDVVMIGDGQVTAGGNTVLKANARKVRTLSDGKVMCGFAGSTADAFTLVERLEAKLEEHPGQLMRACVELAKAWRTDRYLRHLNAEIIAADRDITLILTGVGDVIEPSDDVAGTGSGSAFAVSASRALMPFKELSALDVAQRAMNIAADMCVFTNRNFVIHSLENAKYKPPTDTTTTAAATDAAAPGSSSSGSGASYGKPDA